MNFLQRKETMAWWELGLLKISVASAGILIGIYLYDDLSNLKTLFWITYLGLGLILVYRIWLRPRKRPEI